MSDYLTIPAAASLLGISRASMHRIVRAGLIATLRLPIGGVRIAASDLDLFIRKCRRLPVSSLPTRPRRVTRSHIRLATDALAAHTRRQAMAEIGRGR